MPNKFAPKLYSQMKNTLNFKESLTILGFRDDGLAELVYTLFTSKLMPEIQETNPNIEIKYIDAKLLESLIKKGDEERVYNLLDIKVIDSYQEDINKRHNYFVYIVEQIENLDDPKELIDIFDQANNFHLGKTSFFYVIEDVNTYLKLHDRLSPSSTFFENTFFQPLESTNENEYLKNICNKKYGKIKDQKKLKKIFTESYGHYGLYSQLYKAEITSSNTSLDKYIERLTNSFDEKVLRVFRKLTNEIELKQFEEEMITMYKKLGFIHKNNIIIPILKEYITRLTPKEDIQFDDETGQILMENLNMFSNTETKILKIFLKHRNELVTKELLGEAIWGKENSKKYSPWAIDQNIFRLRMKMDKLNLAGEITTKHGKGYVFEQK